MLITSLSVEGIGRFANAARIDGFAAGVNVLAAGKRGRKDDEITQEIDRGCAALGGDQQGFRTREISAERRSTPSKSIASRSACDGRTFREAWSRSRWNTAASRSAMRR